MDNDELIRPLQVIARFIDCLTGHELKRPIETQAVKSDNGSQ